METDVKVLRRTGTVHGMARSVFISPDGVESILWTCPICGRVEREREDGGTIVTVPGNAPTAEDAERFAELAETPAGRLELSHILYAYPHHDRVYVDQPGLMALAAELGVEEGIGPAVVLSFP